MNKLLFSVALIAILLSIFQVSALRSKKTQPLNSKPFLTDALKSARKSPNHKLQSSKGPILVETSSGAKAQVQDSDSEQIGGNSEYSHFNDGQGNAAFNFSAGLTTESGETLNDASVLFSFNRTNGRVSLNISTLDKIDLNEKDGVSEGCQGYWNAKTNEIVQDEAHSFQNNCYIYSPNSQEAITFQSFKNAENTISQTANKFTWVCNSEGEFYIFSIASCAWVPSASNPITNPNNAIFFIEKSHSN